MNDKIKKFMDQVEERTKSNIQRIKSGNTFISATYSVNIPEDQKISDEQIIEVCHKLTRGPRVHNPPVAPEIKLPK